MEHSEPIRRIGVISDTHGILREEVKEILRTCDTILHGGDVDSLNLLAELVAIAPTIAVQGNNDRNWADPLPVMRDFTLYGLRFCMIHDKKQLPKDLGDYDIIVYGHSHKYEEQKKDGQLWLNPGSCGARRFRLPLTMALLTVDPSAHYQVEQITLSGDIPAFRTQNAAALDPFSRALNPAALEGLSRKDLKKLVQSVMREIDRGITAEQIAAKHSLSLELTEQLCRLYLTHPGIDAEGILRKASLL